MTDASAAERRRNRGPGLARLLSANALATAGLAVFAALAAIALAAPLLPLPDPNATAPPDRLLPPGSAGHLLGTDALGRDLLSRLVWGTRISLAVGLSATAIAAAAGSALGLVAGYAGGRVDAWIMRGIDMVMAFPYILLALAIVAVLGPGLLNALYAIAIVNVPFFARNIRGVTLGLARRDFVDAARLTGKSDIQILATEVLPNVLPVIVITMSTTLGWMILETAGLSFLGLGAQPPQADLGSMLGEGRKVLFTAPHVSLIPGAVILVLVMAVNLLGDGLRDMLDPRLRSGAGGRPSPRTAIAETVRRQAAAETRDSGPSGKDAGADSPPRLNVEGLATEFRTGGAPIRAVGGVDLTLAGGECLGIVGESGSGKSVAALSIMGLVPSPPGLITAGSARLDGVVLFALSQSRIRRLRGAEVAHVFQDPLSTLHPLYTIGDQIVEALRAHTRLSAAKARARAEELLRVVRIPGAAARLDAYPHELSGGMRQRVCIAMALACEPGLLIADEPTTSLDVTVQAQILELLAALRRDSDTAILFISHDFGVVSAVCDRVAVMYAGRVVETGPTEALLAAPAHPYTAGLIDCVPVLGRPRRRGAAISGRPPPLDDLPPGCAFAPRCPRAQADCREDDVALHRTAAGREVRCLHPLSVGEGGIPDAEAASHRSGATVAEASADTAAAGSGGRS